MQTKRADPPSAVYVYSVLMFPSSYG